MSSPFSSHSPSSSLVATQDPSSAATPSNWVQVAPVTTSRLGDRIDGWADTIIGRANSAPDVARNFTVELLPHLKGTMTPKSGIIGISGISALAQGTINPVSPKQIGPTLASGVKSIPELIPIGLGQSASNKRFQYQYVSADPGVNIIAKIATAGNDLFVAWDLYVKPAWNEVVIGLLMFGSLIVGVLSFFSLISKLGSAASLTLDPVSSTFSGALATVWVILLSLFITGVAFIALFGFARALGWLFRRDSTYYIYKKIDLFEHHDIYAMLLGVHKGIQRSIEAVGVDIKSLRQKDLFRGGEKDRLI